MVPRRILPNVLFHHGYCQCLRSRCNSTTTTASSSKRRPRVVVAMSGGVDSSVAAYLLQHPRNNGSYNVNSCVDVIGLHMSNWNALDEDADDTTSSNNSMMNENIISNNNHDKRRKLERTKSSPSNSSFCEASEKDFNDAQSVARHLSIPLHRVSFASEYWIQVFQPFVESLSSSSHHTSMITDASALQKEEEVEANNNDMVMPNPDFGCNTYIKFGKMREYAMDRLNADYIATGHYAQVWHRNYTSSLYKNNINNNPSSFDDWMEETSRLLEQRIKESIAGQPEEEWVLNNNSNNNNNNSQYLGTSYPMLLAGEDRSKDQSYFLSGVKTEAFRNVIFPLGHLAKSQSQQQPTTTDQHHQQSVRDIAHEANIPTASKRDSMGICFIGKRNFGNFVKQYLPEPAMPGDFVDVDTGQIVGKHEGAMHYTIGQGAKISGASVRYFVCGKGGSRRGSVVEDDTNTVFVCNSTHHPALYTDELFVDFDSFNWIGLGRNKSSGRSYGIEHIPRPLIEGRSIKLLARTRHLQPLASCTVTWKQQYAMSQSTTSGNRGHLVVRFDNPMRAITPGQIVALYAGNDGLICLGGGPIKGKGISYMDRGISLSLSTLHPSGHNDLSLSNNS